MILKLQSTLTCPHCEHQHEETMPTTTCLYFYECKNCKTILKPKPGDCCLFYSYSTEKVRLCNKKMLAAIS